MPGRPLVLALALAAAPALTAAPPTADDRAALVGQPTALVVAPATVDLTGPRDVRQLVVTGKYADGTVRDLTARRATATVEPAGVVDVARRAVPAAEEERHRDARSSRPAARRSRCRSPSQDIDKPQPVSFRHDVIAALNVGGCNAGRLPRHAERQERLQALASAASTRPPTTCS